jgi:hypothetical protein
MVVAQLVLLPRVEQQTALHHVSFNPFLHNWQAMFCVFETCYVSTLRAQYWHVERIDASTSRYDHDQ